MKWTISLALALVLAGCATSGLGGTTKLTTRYDSNVQADGSERTVYEQTASGKAGDVLQAVSQANLESADGTGSTRHMSVGATQNNDATRRAESIEAVNQMWATAFAKFADAMTAMISAIAPVVGQVKAAEATAGVEKVKARTGAATSIGTAAAGALTPPTATPTPPLVTPLTLPPTGGTN